MAESQKIADEGSVPRSQRSDDEEPRTSATTTEVAGKVWTVVEHVNEESWDVYAGTRQDEASWLASIGITGDGYFSTDGRGTRRGPYVTLNEAAYPLGLGDPLLLADVNDSSLAESSAPDASEDANASDDSAPAPAPAPRATSSSWLRTGWPIAIAVGAVLLVETVVLIVGRTRRSSVPGRPRS